MSETILPVPLIELPPTEAELPYDDGVPMESARHKTQMDLLIDALIPWLSEREDGFVGGNMFVYYSLARELLPTPEEQERQRADRAEAQLLQTARNLLAGGMTVEQVASVTGLDVAVIEQLISTSEA